MELINKTARFAGFMYLLVAITGFYATFSGKNFIFSGDVSVTVGNILSSIWLFRMNLLSTILMNISWLILAFSLYVLFKSFNKNIVLFMVILVLTGSIIIFISVICKTVALEVLNNNFFISSFKQDQSQSLAILFLELSKSSMFIAYIFFGMWLFPLGYLVFKSEYFPKILGVLLFITGIGYICDFFIFFFVPGLKISITNFTFFGEVLMLLWLLIKGVKEQRDE
jgi:hypothetical protein